MEQLFNKLVRDKIPEIIKEDGGEPKIKTLNEQEYKKELLRKLEEEVQEVVRAQENREALVIEISDVLEVVDAIINEYALERKKIEEIKKERQEKRGGFHKKIFLESVKK